MGVTTRDLEAIKAELKCKICTFMYSEPVALTCGHAFCKRCALQTLENGGKCPLCRMKFTHRSFYPIDCIENACRELDELGTLIGVADIAATQFSQPFVVKPFAPPSLPKRPEVSTQGDVLSQMLREVKSQVVVDDDSSSDEEGEAEKRVDDTECCPQGHPLVLQQEYEAWICNRAIASGERCESQMEDSAPEGVERWSCEECDYDLCGPCYKKAHRGTVCAFCRVDTKARGVEACKAKIESVGDTNGDSADRLWPSDPILMNKKLGAVLGPWNVQWSKGWSKEGAKTKLATTESLHAHDLCLLWSPETRLDGGTFVRKSIVNALRKALRTKCTMCGEYGAAVRCGRKGCKEVFHVPCGLFCGGLTHADEKTTSGFCKNHAPKKKRRR
eukprot:Sspe_Gene.58207::Locus_31929_Transcript_1_1_Confidence_1.000_Length_1403::g.58207::m.58207